MKRQSSNKAAALIVALTCATVLAGLGAATYLTLQSKYRVVHQAASWDESLLTAEAGVEMAMNAIRKELRGEESPWSGWTTSGGTETGSDASVPGATVAPTSHVMISEAMVRRGEGGLSSIATVTVDKPECLKDTGDLQWYRIRSVGTAQVPGGSIAAGDKADLRLRKFDLHFNRRTGAKVDSPQVTRVIEAIAKPVGAFRLALFGTSSIDLNNQNIVVDSYDSRDPQKSRNGGYPYGDYTDETRTKLKRQENGDVATNGTLIAAGGAQVFGDAMTNGGTVTGAGNVTGEVRNDFYQEVISVKRPTNLPDPLTPTAVNGSTVLVAKSDTPSAYQFSTIKMAGNDDEILHITGAADGSPTYCQIVVTGDINTSGKSQIKLDPGVYVRIFVVGDVDITGNGFVNPNSPLHLQLYGCDRPKNADNTPASFGTMKISGNGGFTGAIYAPNFNVDMKGGGNADTIFGAVVANKVSMTGHQAIHYDEAMADGGLISDFKIVSWFEDER